MAPYRVHLVALVQQPADIERCTTLYDDLERRGVEVLYDDRTDPTAGEKLADADLIGLPHRLVVSRRTLATDSVEWKKRTSEDKVVLPMQDLMARFVSS